MDKSPAITKRHDKVLVLIDQRMAGVLAERIAALRASGAVVMVIDYRHLMREVEPIRRVLREHGIDCVLFGRNDQVFERIAIGSLIRALGVGYSSFSGIDTDAAVAQTTTCLDDFLAGDRRLELPPPSSAPLPPQPDAGTFSLIFDLEQLGCARFGLPRVLRVLERYGASATFFTTNIVQDVYANVTAELVARGHEVGVHGCYHEYLAGHAGDVQSAMIRQMRDGFGPQVPISGGNFIFRMDAATVEAMVANDLQYFVVFMEHRYTPFHYRKMRLRPLLTWTPRGTIWMAPVSVETNNRPWFAVKNMLDAALVAGRAEGWHHVNVLLHPFRDGALRHIGDLERLLEYLYGTHGYRATTMADHIRQLPKSGPSRLIYYGLEGTPHRSQAGRFAQGWWHHSARYQQRVSNVYDALVAAGHQPAVCLHPPAGMPVDAVYPYLPDDSTPLERVMFDPLRFTVSTPVPTTHGRAYVPRGYGDDLRLALRTQRPRRSQDVTGLLPEVALRVAYRLTPGRHLF